MDSQDIERVFGGLHYLFWAGSKREFFSHLECCLAELFGARRFSVLAAAPGGETVQVEYSSHPSVASAGLLAGQPEITASVLEEARSTPARPSAARRALPACAAPQTLEGVHRLNTGEEGKAWLVFHDPPGGRAAGIFGLEDLLLDHIAFAYHWISRQDSLRARLDVSAARLAAINGLGELLGSLDLDVLLTKLLELSLFLAGAQVGSVVLCGEKGVESRVEWGLPLELAQGLAGPDGHSILERVLRSGQAELARQVHAVLPGDWGSEVKADSFLCVPLASKGRLLGAVNLVDSAGSPGFTGEDRDSILTISRLAATAVENALLYRSSLEKERLRQELRLARGIQHRLYPKEGPRLPGYQVAWVNESSAETGGDYFDFIPLEGDSLAVTIGDVSGHGMGAALLMATARANLRALLSLGKSIEEVVTALDALLMEDMEDDMFMTLFLGRIEPGRHLLTYLNAGHDAPLLYRCGRRQVEALEATGLPLGVLGRESRHEAAGACLLERGDVLLLSSDGVWEGTDARGVRFGKDRLARALEELAHRAPAEIVHAIRKDVRAFTGGVEPRDDLTLVALKRVE